MHTGEPLKLASHELLAQVKSAVEESRLHDVGGRQMETTIEAALVNETETFLYPITREVVQLMRDEVVDLTQLQEHQKDV